MLHVLIPLLARFQEKYPLIRPELNTDEKPIDLLREQTDIACRIGPLPDSTLNFRYLGESRLRLLASPRYLAKRGTPGTPADLRNHSLLGFNAEQDYLNRRILSADGQSLMPSSPAITASDGESLRALALAGCGIVCLADFMTREDRQNGSLTEILPGQIGTRSQSVQAVYYKQAGLPLRIKIFLDFLEKNTRTLL